MGAAWSPLMAQVDDTAVRFGYIAIDGATGGTTQRTSSRPFSYFTIEHFLILFCNKNNRRRPEGERDRTGTPPVWGTARALPSRAITLLGVVCSGEQW